MEVEFYFILMKIYLEVIESNTLAGNLEIQTLEKKLDKMKTLLMG